MQHYLFKTLIIDDEPDARFVLSELIRRFCPQIEVCCEASTVEEGLIAIQKHQPDLIFLDIDLNEGNGFDVLKAFPRNQFKVVFVTGHDDYALKAFAYRAWHYLLKPVAPQDLIQLVLELIQDSVPPVAQKNPPVKISFPTINGTILIEPSEIVYFNTDDKYATVFLSNTEKVFISLALKEILGLISEDTFMRTHRSYVVSIDFVRKIQKGLDGETVLVLKDKSVIPVSRRAKEEVFARLGHLR